MQLFGLTIARTKTLLSALRPMSTYNGFVTEPFAGAWQRGIVADSTQDLLAFSAVFACIRLISGDISKLRIKLVEQDRGIWRELSANSPFLPVLRKPNHYQTRNQFIESWVISKLVHGNTYILKERDARGVVVAMYVLDPRRCWPLVTDEGDVYYSLSRDPLSRSYDVGAVPASEIIHDRMCCFFHPLVGIPPIYACAASTTQGIRIQNNSAKFFENMSRPSGHLTAPGRIDDATVARLQKSFEEKFGGGNLGRLLVTGDGLSYQPMTIPADQAQLVEQLDWTAGDVARAFQVPPHKLGLEQPTLNNIGALNMDYYSQTLQVQLEAIETLLDEGLGLTNVSGKTLGTEFDLEGLLRMDPLSRADRNERAIRAGYLKPDEARASEDLPPVTGGNQCFLQMQNYSLEAIAKRDAREDPFATSPKAQP